MTLPISAKDAAILKADAAGVSAKAAVANAGFDMKPSNAETYVEHIKSKYTDAQGNLLVELDNVGVDLSTVASTIKDGLQATRPAKSGKDIVDRPDFATRHKYLETTLDIMGAKAPKQHVVQSISTHEETVIIADNVRSNPELLMAIKQRVEERRKAKEIDVTPQEGSGDE